MPNPTTNFKDDYGTDLGNKIITKEYLMTVYPQIANQLITPELWIWGIGTAGVLGNNDSTNSNRTTPVTTFAGGTNWKQVSCGRYYAAAIKTDGTLWVWGSNSFRQLGTNNGSDTSTPITTFAGGNDWKQVSCGRTHTAAIKTDGTLWTWGNNSSGQLGNFTTITQSIPITTFAGGTNWKQVVCGGTHTAAIKTDGTLWNWGSNSSGQLGDNTITNKDYPITTFPGGTDWKQVHCGTSYTAAIKTDGTLWVWGWGNSGRLGTNDIISRSIPVTTFAGGTNWKQVFCGDYHTSAIKTDGTLWTWGDGSSGQLGNNNTTTRRSTPVTTFAGGNNWKQVGGGVEMIAAIKTDGTLWVWGRNSHGQLGDNTNTNRFTPVTTFAGGTNWKQVGGGYYITGAIRTSDDLQGI